MPGVGAYGDLMKRVKSKKLDIFIKNKLKVISKFLEFVLVIGFFFFKLGERSK